MHAADLPITALRELLDSRLLSSTELAEACIARTEAAAALNVYASFDAEALRAQARSADQRLAAGERLPLLGIPIALKDNIDAVGWPCAVGTGALQGRAPAADAELVQRLRAAGAAIAGKLGMHELAFGITSHNAVSGAVHNPCRPRLRGRRNQITPQSDPAPPMPPAPRQSPAGRAKASAARWARPRMPPHAPKPPAQRPAP